MSYVATPPKFEAIQWTGTDFDTYKATVDPTDARGVVLNADGSVSYIWAMTETVPVGTWLISLPYYGSFPGWQASILNILSDADFRARYEVST